MLLSLLIAGVALAGVDPAIVAQYKVACDAGEVLACRTLAGSFADGAEVPKDEAGARQWGAKGCALGDAPSCHILGFLEATGLGGPKDLAAAESHLKKGCDADIARSCANVGDLYYGEQRWELARSAYQRGCAGSDPSACYGTGSMLLQGLGGPKDGVAGGAALRKACDVGLLPACSMLAAGVGSGDVPGDKAESRTIAKKACDAGFMDGCTTLGTLIAQGIGGSAEPREGLALMQRACDAGDARGCDSVGVLYAGGFPGIIMIADNARAAFKKACDGNYAQGCAHYGGFLRQLAEPGTTAEWTNALLRACQLGDKASCDLGM